MNDLINKKASEVYKLRSELESARQEENNAKEFSDNTMEEILAVIADVRPELAAEYRNHLQNIEIAYEVRKAKEAEAKAAETELREIAEERATILIANGEIVYSKEKNAVVLHPHIKIQERKYADIPEENIPDVARWLQLNGHGHAIEIKVKGDTMSLIERRAEMGTLPLDYLGRPAIKFGTKPKSTLDGHDKWDVQA